MAGSFVGNTVVRLVQALSLYSAEWRLSCLSPLPALFWVFFFWTARVFSLPHPACSLARRDFFLSLLIQQRELLEALGLEQAAPPSVTLPTAPILLAFSSSARSSFFLSFFS